MPIEPKEAFYLRATLGAFSCWFATGFLLACLPVAAKELTPHEIYLEGSSAVVSIQTDSGIASGFLVSSDGKIVTNFHVIANTKRASIRLQYNDDVYNDVQVLDIDKRKDIAILKIKAVDLSFLRLGESEDQVIGATVYSVSNPEGYLNTFSQGLISGIRYRDALRIFQFTAPTSHGSSGGPLFNAKGEVIGITSSSQAEGQNINFAVPVEYVRRMLASSGQARSLDSVRDPTYDPWLASSGLSGGKQTFKQRALEMGTAAVRLTLLLLTCWFAVRMARQIWSRTNDLTRYHTMRMKLWVKVGCPVLLCAAAATLMVLEYNIVSLN